MIIINTHLHYASIFVHFHIDKSIKNLKNIHFRSFRTEKQVRLVCDNRESNMKIRRLIMITYFNLTTALVIQRGCSNRHHTTVNSCSDVSLVGIILSKFRALGPPPTYFDQSKSTLTSFCFWPPPVNNQLNRSLCWDVAGS